ncbi:Protein of unknown function [Gryllus bimaculatus]|nr:Protein of unknown function [Gryllus bimaculatus]
MLGLPTFSLLTCWQIMLPVKTMRQQRSHHYIQLLAFSLPCPSPFAFHFLCCPRANKAAKKLRALPGSLFRRRRRHASGALASCPRPLRVNGAAAQQGARSGDLGGGEVAVTAAVTVTVTVTVGGDGRAGGGGAARLLCGWRWRWRRANALAVAVAVPWRWAVAGCGGGHAGGGRGWQRRRWAGGKRGRRVGGGSGGGAVGWWRRAVGAAPSGAVVGALSPGDAIMR